MPSIEDLTQVLSQYDVTHAQGEALVDLVVWTMYVDGAIRHEENERLDEIVARLDAVVDVPLTGYLNASIAKIRDVWNDAEAAQQTLAEIDDHLGQAEMRRTAYALCETIAHADSEMADAEHRFLTTLRRQFGLEESGA